MSLANCWALFSNLGSNSGKRAMNLCASEIAFGSHLFCFCPSSWEQWVSECWEYCTQLSCSLCLQPCPKLNCQYIGGKKLLHFCQNQLARAVSFPDHYKIKWKSLFCVRSISACSCRISFLVYCYLLKSGRHMWNRVKSLAYDKELDTYILFFTSIIVFVIHVCRYVIYIYFWFIYIHLCIYI